jgi:DNA polymerase I
MIAHYSDFNPEAKQGMDFLWQNFTLKYQTCFHRDVDWKERKKSRKYGRFELQKKSSDYACEDADITFQLKQVFEPEIQKEHLKELFYNMEMPLVQVLKSIWNQKELRLMFQSDCTRISPSNSAKISFQT